MSLLNQVLRDLDQRHAAATPVSPAIRPAQAAQPPAARRTWRWASVAALVATAALLGAVTQGSIAWPLRSAAAPAAPAASEPTPVRVASIAPPTEPAHADIAPPVMPTAALLPAPAAPMAAHKPAPAPALEPSALTAAPIAPAAPAARIDKRLAAATPQERAQADYQRGVIAHQAGQFNDAADAFSAALREDAGFAPARQAQAGWLVSQSRFDEAERLLQDGLAITPQQPLLTLMLARLQADRHDLAAAATTLTSALAQAKQDAEYLGFYAAVLQQTGRHADAAAQFSAALRLSPVNSVWWMGLGISLSAEGQNGAAREAFGRAQAIGALPSEAEQYVALRLRQLL